MSTYLTKLRYILPTFLTISFAIVTGLLLFRWLFAIHYELLDLKEEMWELWLPMLLPWVPVLIWLRPKLRILSFKKDNDHGRFSFQFLAGITLVVCLMVSQSYLTTATGKLERMGSIYEMDSKEKARYYVVSNFSVAPYFGGSFTNFRASGKYNQYLHFDVYFVTPFLKDSLTLVKEIPTKWYCVKFTKEISNRISESEKERKYKAFYNECVEKMKNYDFQALAYFERTPTSNDKEHFFKAVEARIVEAPPQNTVILEPKSGPFRNRNGNKLAWIFGSFGIGLSVFLFALIWPGYDRQEHQNQLADRKPKKDDLVDMLKYLVPRGDHFATSVILDLNILVFLLMVFSGVSIFSPSGQELLEWGANRRMETTAGEWWRLLTSMFLHGGLMHLTLNIIGLVFAAPFIEPLLGRIKYFVLYVLSGLAGSVASICWYENILSVGASGAIFGLYGAILGLLLTNAFPKEGRGGIFAIIGLYVGINLLWGLTGGVDNAAHIGGLLSGVVLGIALFGMGNGRKNSGRRIEKSKAGKAI